VYNRRGEILRIDVGMGIHAERINGIITIRQGPISSISG
jgi:hypothetical protein